MSMTDHIRPVEPAAPLHRGGVQLFIVLVCCLFCGHLAVQIVSSPPPPRSTVGRSLQIELNSAPVRELSLLPGIGPVLANRIVKNRQKQGDFRSVDSLQRVHGIGPKTVVRVKHLCVTKPNRFRLAAK